MARARVRTHKRKVNGKTVTVHQHARNYRAGIKLAGYKPRIKKKRAFIDGKRGARTLGAALYLARKNQKAWAVGFAALGAAEITGFLLLRGTGIIMATASAGLALGASAALSRTVKENKPVAPIKKAVQKKAPPAKKTITVSESSKSKASFKAAQQKKLEQMQREYDSLRAQGKNQDALAVLVLMGEERRRFGG